MNELDCILSLNAVPGLGNIRIRKLLDHFGGAKKVFESNQRELAFKKIVPAEVSKNIIRFNHDDYLKKEYSLAEKHNVRIVTYKDKNYPKSLKNIDDAPVILYVKGEIDKDQDLAMAVVGSRRASIYGISMAEKLTIGLSELGITIVSGMARGIDTAAHRGALKAKGATIAVLGCGLSRVYPPENKGLMQDIISSGGAVVSEFSMEEAPVAHNFPRRNRIISGLSLGVVVVEAAQKSGALITSDCALDQGKEVFAVPGKVDAPNSRGVHKLIKQGAKLVSNIEDILEEIKPNLENRLAEIKKENVMPYTEDEVQSLSKEENQIYSQINGKGIHIDELTQRCGLSTSQVMNILLRLELKRCIKQLPGKVFIKN